MAQFKKGQVSPNPKGRPRKSSTTEKIRAANLEHAAELLEQLRLLALGGDVGGIVMTGNVISLAAARDSRARIAHTREMLHVARLLEDGGVVPFELSQKHDIDEISRWLREIAENDD